MIICAYGRNNGTWIVVTNKEITTTVRSSVVACGLLEQGFSLDQVGSHSLRAGGAMVLTLNGFDDTIVKKLGRLM
eukprot:12984390-Ditylum_brightwellii.AAC.2